MKERYFERETGYTSARLLTFVLPLLMRSVVNGEEADPTPIDTNDLRNLCVRVRGIGETGRGRAIGTTGSTRYELGESEIIVYVTPEAGKVGDIDVNVFCTYGQVCLRAELVVGIDGGEKDLLEGAPLVFSVVAGGGGADYKTDIYMDGAGRVVLERLEDGSTMLLDEHENPILKRNADGTTQYFDAYQSARLMIGEHGEVEVAYTEDEVVKTLAVAEAILARTQKRLLYNTAGETTIKDADGNILTHADIYAMLMTSPDFVVLVRSDHAFHPNLVTPTQIAFTCSYLGADGQISAERVNITDENVVTYTSGKGVSLYKNGLSFGINSYIEQEGAFAHGISCNGRGRCSHAEGNSCLSSADFSHAEGKNSESHSTTSHAEGSLCLTFGDSSHAEGTHCKTNAGTSHAEGNYCETGTNGGSAHAEGSYTNANAAASHTEGYRTITTEGGQHAQGCWNKSEGGQYAFMHGCGTSEEDRKNAVLFAGTEVYMYGIGGYDGTNYGQEGVQSLQEFLLSLNQ